MAGSFVTGSLLGRTPQRTVAQGLVAVWRTLHAVRSQVTLDDLWKLDLAKLDGWQMVKDNTAGKADFDEGDAESSEDSSDWESEEGGAEALPKVSAVAKKRTQ